MKQLKESQRKINEYDIFKKCNKLLKEAEVKKPPVDPKILASLAGVTSVSEKVMEHAGTIHADKNGRFNISLNKEDSEQRKRFTCCHEIAHTLMPNFKLKPHQRINDRNTGNYSEDNYLEYLCDYGASELLMPSFLFNIRFLDHGFNIDSLKRLSEEFNASLEATAIKMVKRDYMNYAFVIWEKLNKPSEINTSKNDENLPTKKLRVRWGYGGNFHIPKHKSLEETNGIIEKSYNDSMYSSGIEEISFGKIKKKFKVQTLPLKKHQRILTLLEEVK